MIRSMTGFGDASSHANGAAFGVEIRSVNNKFLKTIMRLPEQLATLEPEFEAIIRSKLARGTVTLTVSMTDASDHAAFEVNEAALRKYIEQLEGIGSGPIDTASLLSLPGVLVPPTPVTDQLGTARKALKPLIENALDHLISMRKREGISLHDDLRTQHDLIKDRLGRIAELAPQVVADYEARLKARITKLLADAEVKAEPGDLIREIAIFAEKADIAEELVRLGEHLVHFSDLISSDDDRPIGRTLDFLSQELLREANTIASKSPDAAMARLIVEIKGAIDRIKEQVQNAE